MAHTVQNTAYDLSRYEPKVAKRQPRLRVVEKPSPRNGLAPTELFQAGLVGAVMVAALCMVLYSNAILTELSDQISTSNEKLSVLTSENQRLSAVLEGKMSLRNIEDIAKNEMGLSKMEPYQVEYVNRCDGDKIVRTAESPSESILGKIANRLNSVLEYLRITFNKN